MVFTFPIRFFRAVVLRVRVRVRVRVGVRFDSLGLSYCGSLSMNQTMSSRDIAFIYIINLSALNLSLTLVVLQGDDVEDENGGLH